MCGVFLHALGVLPLFCGMAPLGRGQSGAARQGRQVALLGPAFPSANGSAGGQCPGPPGWACGVSIPTEHRLFPLPSPGCRSRKFPVNYHVQTSIVEGDTSGAGSDGCQPLPARSSSCPFHFELLWRTKRFFERSKDTPYNLPHPFFCREQTLFFLLYLEHLDCIQGLVWICDRLSLASAFFQSVSTKNCSPWLYCSTSFTESTEKKSQTLRVVTVVLSTRNKNVCLNFYFLIKKKLF